ncbi:MAG: thiamine diphosphokinase [Ruthenibacterium sp.]
MKRCVIFAAMPVSTQLSAYYENADIILAADAGYVSVQNLKLTPTLLLGDYDSAPVPQSDAPVLQLPAEKDDTDTYFAAKKAMELGAEEVIILGGLGGRLDHTLANLQTILFLQQNGISAMLADENTEVRVLLAGEHMLYARENHYVSLFPVGVSATGITLTGFKYPLTNAELTNTWPVGVSNEFAAQTAKVTVKTGGLYCIICAK